ncbi:MAG: hypothetical protein IJ661_01405 [Lachnospiraceae bacterium]|nr:hypothetical protein [Lachnospiraceae bacterium]
MKIVFDDEQWNLLIYRKQYVMNGDTTVELSGILDCIGIAGISEYRLRLV